jgi:hypothetical protein
VKGCLAPEPDERWQSARDVKRLLLSVGETRVEPVRHLGSQPLMVITDWAAATKGTSK